MLKADREQPGQSCARHEIGGTRVEHALEYDSMLYVSITFFHRLSAARPFLAVVRAGVGPLEEASAHELLVVCVCVAGALLLLIVCRGRRVSSCQQATCR